MTSMLARAWRAAVALLTLLLVAPHVARGVSPEDVLRPEQAFRYEAVAEGAAIVVRWTIEPGYYLYKERMAFTGRTPGVVLGPVEMPAGLPYHDEFFGDMHVYRNEAVVRIPVREPGPGLVDLEIRSQGCADIGLCYPPQVWTTKVALQPASLGRATRTGALASLLGAPRAGDPLPPEKAFRVSASLVRPDLLRVTWEIAEGYYLYRSSVKVASASPGLELGPLSLPAGTPKEDEYFGKTQVFYQEAVGEAPVTGRAEPLQLRINHQGCKENSICYPPQTLLLTVSQSAVAGAPGGGAFQPMVSEQDQFARMIASENIGLVMLLALVAGLGLSLLPCCWPMIPILSGIIVGEGKDVTTGRAFALSLTYVLGMAVVYTAAGALAAAAGQQVQSTLQQPWIIGGVAALFVAMALSMFGLYELKAPAALMNRINAISGRQKAGTFVGTAVMGALSALVVSACVAPPLVGALTFIAQTGDVTRGALALFTLAIGMGVPLLVIGASGGRLLPRAGPWMNQVKGGFGFVMLGLAIWMLDRVLPDSLTMVLWAALVFMAGVFLGAFQSLDADASTPSKLAKGMGLLAAIYGTALLLGALAGGGDPLRPLGTLQAGGGASEETSLPFRRVKTVAEFDQAAAAAAAAGQPVMLDFYADWCTSCIEMERYTFTSAEVRAALKGAVLLQADVTANDEADKALLARFDIFGPPTIIFFGSDGQERDGYRVVGFKDAAAFANHVRSAFGA